MSIIIFWDDRDMRLEPPFDPVYLRMCAGTVPPPPLVRMSLAHLYLHDSLATEYLGRPYDGKNKTLGEMARTIFKKYEPDGFIVMAHHLKGASAIRCFGGPLDDARVIGLHRMSILFKELRAQHPMLDVYVHGHASDPWTTVAQLYKEHFS